MSPVCCHRRQNTEPNPDPAELDQPVNKAPKQSDAPVDAPADAPMDEAASPVCAASVGVAADAAKREDAGDAAADIVTWEDIKAEGTKLYMADDYAGAASKYGSAIEALERACGGSPTEDNDLRSLAILYTNRAACNLQIVKRAQEKKRCRPGQTLEPNLRRLAMLANVDASRATDLDPENAKAWLRRGQALLWSSAMQHRAKEAERCLEVAQKSSKLPASMKKEVQLWMKLARNTFNEQTDMPANCPQT